MSYGCSGSIPAATTAIIAASVVRSSRDSTHAQDDISWVDCCSGLIRTVISGLQFIFCIKNLTVFNKIGVAWFWMILFSVSLSLVIGVGLYGSQNIVAAKEDMRVITKSFSTFICEGYKLSSSLQSNFYLMPDVPPIDRSKRKNSTVSMTKIVDPWPNFGYWKFYMLAGSNITVSSCSDGTVFMYVIKGLKNFEEWSNSKSRASILAGQVIYRTVPCPRGLNDPYHLDVIDTDDYYFAYEGDFRTADVTVKFYLSRTSYELTSAIQRQESVLDAFFELSYRSTEVVIYQIQDSIFASSDTADLETHCLPRVAIYFFVLVFPPLCLGGLVTFLLLRSRSKQNIASVESANRPRVQLRNEGPATPYTPLRSSLYYVANSINQQPATQTSTNDDQLPTYSQVEHLKHSPPSYEDSMKKT